MRKENSKTSVEEPKELPSGALRCGGLPIITWAGKTPMMTIFDWDDIDHSLVGLKLTDMAEEMRKLISEDEARIRLENRHNANRAAVPTLILRMKEQRADEWAQKAYDIYCDVWRIQGRSKSASFIRAVSAQSIIPMLSARAQAIAQDLVSFSVRTGFPAQLATAKVNGMQLRMTRLQARWRRKLEAEAKECEHAERILSPHIDDPPEKTVPLTKAPPPVAEVGGRGVIHGPKPTEMLPDLPVDYPRALVARTFVIVGEAVRKFPVQTRTQELCRYVISELTPHFREGLRAGVFRQDQALSKMHELLHSLLVYNSTESRRCEIQREVLKSDEWLDFAKAIAGETDNGAPVKADSISPESAGPEVATWETIEISFLSDERVQIRDGDKTETRNSTEFGFEDRRSGKPNRAWETLRALAEQGGIIRDTAKTGHTWAKVEKRIQEIRRVLRKHFGISADPIPFVEGAGYQAHFKINCRPSYHT